MRRMSVGVDGRVLALLGVVALAGCPQEIRSVEAEAGLDASVPPPTCANAGPSVGCTAVELDRLFAPMEIAQFQCDLPAAGRKVVLRSLKHGRADLRFASNKDSQTGRVDVSLLREPPLPVSFSDTAVKHFITLGYEDDPVDTCTVVEVTSRWAGNLWIADQENGRVVVLDSGGATVNAGLRLDGMDKPRLLARVSDGVLVGGMSEGSAALAVYSLDGRRVREYSGIASQFGARPFQAAATINGTLYLAVGGSLKELWRVAPGTPTLAARGVTSVAALNEKVGIATLSTGNAYLRLSSEAPDGSQAGVEYRDASGATCPVEGAAAVCALTGGGFAFSLFHLESGANPSGMEAVFTSSFQVETSTWHVHAPRSGRLATFGPHDWLEEIRPRLVAASRDGGSTLDLLALDALDEQAGTTATWTLPENATPKGLLRLR